MPPPLLERLALEFLRVLVLVLFIFFIFVLIFGPLQTDDDLELQAEQRADRSLDSTDIDWAKQQHIDKLKFLHLARRLRIDQHTPCRAARVPAAAERPHIVNAGLARRADFTRPS